MRVGLYSIPATGTRFVASALRHLGADYSRRHVGDVIRIPEWLRVLPVRNPYDCYCSHMHHGHSKTDAEFISKWAYYIWRTQWMDAFYFPLDVPEDNRRGVLQSLMSFCGLERDMSLIDSFQWEVIGKTEHDLDGEIHGLGFAKEWYDHYTLYWGVHMRHSNNMIGEK